MDDEFLKLLKDYGWQGLLAIGIFGLVRWFVVSIQPYAIDWLKGQINLVATITVEQKRQTSEKKKQTKYHRMQASSMKQLSETTLELSKTISELSKTTASIHGVEQLQDEKLKEIADEIKKNNGAA